MKWLSKLIQIRYKLDSKCHIINLYDTEATVTELCLVTKHKDDKT